MFPRFSSISVTRIGDEGVTSYYSFSDMYAKNGGSVVEIGFMGLYTDMNNQKLFLNCTAYDTIAPDANSALNSSLLYQNSAPTFQLNNHQCYSSGNAYGDFYWWIQNSQFMKYLPCPFYDKTSTCSLYTYRYSTTDYAVILTPNNYIQQLNITDNIEISGAYYKLGYMSMDFHSFTPSILGNPFVEPKVCHQDQSNNYFCPVGPKLQQTIYFLHAHDDTTINSNVGDLLGYTSFLCWKSSLGDDLILTQAVVEMNPAWGQYSQCYSESNCIGGNAISVGRECPYGFLYLQGQCANLTNYGQWFSLRNDARCPLLSPVGTNGCAWHLKYVTKSISFQCLINQGFFDYCYSDSQIPFNSAAAAVSHAYTYCPSVTTLLDVNSNGGVDQEMIEKGVISNSQKLKNLNNHHLDSSAYPIRILKRSQPNS